MAHENVNLQNAVKVDDQLLGTIKIAIVIMDKLTVLRKVKNVDDTIAGIINKIIKGLVTPPVRYNSNKLNWIRSYNRINARRF